MAILACEVNTTWAQPSRLPTPTLAIRRPSLVTLVITRPTLTSTTIISLGNDTPDSTTVAPLAETSTNAEPVPAEGSGGISTTGVVILGLVLGSVRRDQVHHRILYTTNTVGVAAPVASKEHKGRLGCKDRLGKQSKDPRVSKAPKGSQVPRGLKVNWGCKGLQVLKANLDHLAPLASLGKLVLRDRKGRPAHQGLKDGLALLAQTDKQADQGLLDHQEKMAEMAEMEEKVATVALELMVNQGRLDVTVHRVHKGHPDHPDHPDQLDQLDHWGPRVPKVPKALKGQTASLVFLVRLVRLVRLALLVYLVLLVKEVPMVAEKGAIPDLGATAVQEGLKAIRGQEGMKVPEAIPVRDWDGVKRVHAMGITVEMIN
ncbi:hypothetical protein PG993_009449 [Apiospora rasikravindrae]|uniref:Uncharacterized protein n=1 Tax=Apiospora rasikravindrae TaxID=990691 RepID=A0ABR1SJF8_9PEZI